MLSMNTQIRKKYTEDDIINMLEFLFDNIFVVFGGKVFQQIVGIPMGTNCAPLLADIFLYSYEADFIQSLLSTGKKNLASQFNFTYRYIDDVLSINNQDFENYLRVRCIPLNLRSKTRRRATPLLPTWIYSCRSEEMVSCTLPFPTNVTIPTSISQTFRSWVAIFHLRQPMAFWSHSSYGMPGLAPLMNVYRGRLLLRTPGPVPFGTCICCNVETILSWTCHVYGPFEFRTSLGTSILLILWAVRLSFKLLGQWYVMERLKSSFRKFYGRYGDLIKHYEVSLSQMLHDILGYDNIQWQPQ